MATIRHVAFYSDNPKTLAEFWHDVFNFEITGVTDWGDAWVTDGYMHIALLRRLRPEGPDVGINHFGVTVDEDEKDDVYAKMAAIGLEPKTAEPLIIDGVEVHRPFVEDKSHDIDGNMIDVSIGVKEFRPSIPT